MISAQVQRKEGLNEIISVILASTNPPSDLFNMGNFYPLFIVSFLSGQGFDARRLAAHVDQFRKGGEDYTAPSVDALQDINLGKDYLSSDAKKLRMAFPFGRQRYVQVFAETNSYNPQVAVDVFPRNASSLSDKRQMLVEFGGGPWSAENDYAYLKTLLATDGNANILVVTNGSGRVDLETVASQLGTGSLSLVPSKEVLPIVGRRVGVVSMLMHNSCFGNINSVAVPARMEGYAEPYYNFPLSKSSALVVSDFRDVTDALAKIHGYPQIRFLDGI